MNALLIKGGLLGLTLSFMIGPLFFAVVETTLSRGHRSGLAVAAGIWASDVMFIVLVQKGLAFMVALVGSPSFRLYAGLLGGAMLVLFGVGSWVGSARARAADRAKEQQILPKEKDLFHIWLRGFTLNALNPGTMLFWLGTATGIIAPNAWVPSQVLVFLGAMMAVLVVTDILKVYGAKRLRQWLTPSHVLLVRQVIGAVLVVFGVVMWVEVLVN